MFETRNALAAKITSLESENTELREEITELSAQLKESADQSETIAGLNTQLEGISNEFAAAKSEWATKESELSEELAEAQAKAAPEAIQALVTAELAKCAHAPVTVSVKTEKNGSDKMEVTRSEFSAMTPYQKSEFSKRGGKIKE